MPPESEPHAAVALVGEGRAAFRTADYARSERLFRAALGAGADELDCRQHLARLYNLLNDWPEALQQWLWLREHAEGRLRVESRLQVARGYFRLGNHVAAAAEFEEVLASDPDHAEARHRLRQIGTMRKEIDPVAKSPVEVPKAALASSPVDGSSRDDGFSPVDGSSRADGSSPVDGNARLVAEGRAAFRAQDFDTSERLFIEALATGADAQVCRLHLARIYNSRSEWANALAQWRWLHDRDPGALEPQLQVARALFRLRCYEQATAGFKAVLDLSPDHAEALQRLREIEVLRGDPRPHIPSPIGTSAIGPSAIGPSAIGPSAADPSARSLSVAGASQIDPSASSPSEVGASPIDPSAIDPSAIDSSAIGPSAIDASAGSPSMVGASPSGPSPIDPSAIDPSPSSLSVVGASPIDSLAIDASASSPPMVGASPIDPSAIEAQQVAPRVSSARSVPGPPPPSTTAEPGENERPSLVDEAKAAFAGDKLEYSKALFARAIEQGADEAVCRLHLARIHNVQEEWQQALDHWTWLRDKDRSRLEPHLQIGRAQLNLGYYGEAAEAFEMVLAVAPDHAEAKDRLRQAKALGEQSEAEDLANGENWLSLVPESLRWQLATDALHVGTASLETTIDLAVGHARSLDRLVRAFGEAKGEAIPHRQLYALQAAGQVEQARRELRKVRAIVRALDRRTRKTTRLLDRDDSGKPGSDGPVPPRPSWRSAGLEAAVEAFQTHGFDAAVLTLVRSCLPDQRAAALASLGDALQKLDGSAAVRAWWLSFGANPSRPNAERLSLKMCHSGDLASSRALAAAGKEGLCWQDQITPHPEERP